MMTNNTLQKTQKSRFLLTLNPQKGVDSTTSTFSLRKTTAFISLLCVVAFGINTANAQVGMMNNNPDKSAVLDLSNTNKGLLPPRIGLTSLTDKTSINGGNPATGLLVFNTNTSLTGGTGFYYWDGDAWKKFISQGDSVAGDNLGNHIATQDLDMANNNINAATNITANGKITTNKAQIKIGKDNMPPLEGYVATAADTNGNIVWKPSPKQNIVPDDIGTVIAINGELLVAQEITAQMSSNYYKRAISGIEKIGNITNIIIDNKGRFFSNSSGNSFTVEEDGTYLITINTQITSPYNEYNAPNNQAFVLGIVDNITGQWVARVNDSFVAPNFFQTYTLITSIDLYKSRNYSFAMASTLNSATVMAYSTGITGTGPVSFFSVKRLR